MTTMQERLVDCIQDAHALEQLSERVLDEGLEAAPPFPLPRAGEVGTG